VMERAMMEYLANALWQLPVYCAGEWDMSWLMKPVRGTVPSVADGVGIADVAAAWGISHDKIVWRCQTRPLARPSISWRRRGSYSDGCGGRCGRDGSLTCGVSVQEKRLRRKCWDCGSRARVHMSATVTHWLLGGVCGFGVLGLLRVARAWHSARGAGGVVSGRWRCVSAAKAVLRDFGGASM